MAIPLRDRLAGAKARLRESERFLKQRPKDWKLANKVREQQAEIERLIEEIQSEDARTGEGPDAGTAEG